MGVGRAIFFKLASVVVFLAMQAMVKATTGHVPAGEAVFFRSVFALPVILIWLAWQGALPDGFRAKTPMAHLWRGFLGACVMGLSFTALGLLPLPEVTALFYATPILTVIFAAMFLGERIRLRRLGAVGMGMIGVVIILSPRMTAFRAGHVEATEALGASLVLLAAVLAALAKIFLRKLVLTEKPATIVFYFSLNVTLLSLVTIPFGWVWPEPPEFALLIGAGIAGGVAQSLLTTAFRHAEASVIAPFDYSSLLVSLAIGYFIFAELPTRFTLIGAGFVIAGGGLILWRERQLGIQRARQRQAMTPQGD